MNKSSFFLAILLIANPFILLFFQNCSVLPHVSTAEPKFKNGKVHSPKPGKAVVQNSFEKTL